VVGAYKKVEDKFVDQYLTKDGESVEDAKARLKSEQSDRDESHKEEQAKREAKQQEMIQASIERSRNAGKR
jgi:ribosomal protein L9